MAQRSEDSELNFSSTAFPDADEREISSESAEKSELVFARQNAETVNLQGEIVPKRNISGREILLEQPSPAGGGHGSMPRFQHNPEPTSSSTTQMSTSASRACENELQVQLIPGVDTAGLCIICSCTEPYNGEHIEYHTAPEKMAECFQMKLGYSLYEVKNVSKSRMETLMSDLSNLEFPSNINFRIIFYFFGHGTENEICLKDGNFERSKIITALQNISKDMVRMVLFDSCRLVSKDQSSSIPIDVPPNQYDLKLSMEKPIQAVGSLPGRSDWKDVSESSCPDCFNMLVINATDYSGEAYYAVSDTYPDIKGCGLVTYFFTRLVAEMNQPLVAVLVDVRKKVDDFLKKETNRCPDAKLRPQVLMYQDRTIERVNLLAESKGTERVKPEIVCVEPSVLTTIVQWVFRLNVDGRIKTFRVRCHDEKGNIMEINAKLTLKNVAKFENCFLKSNKEYKIQVAAVYNDGDEAWSKESSFVTPALASPSDMSITPFSRGSSKATLKWKFDGDSADLETFCVQVDGKDVKKVHGCDGETELDGLRPATANHIKLIAVYKDGRQTECVINYQNDELEQAKISSVHLISLSPLTLDVKWQFGTDDQINLVQPCHYRVLDNDRVVLEECHDIHAEIQLDYGTEYNLKVETCYTNENLVSDVLPYTTPTEDDIKPTIAFSELTRNSVKVTVTDPPIFQRRSEFHAESVNLKGSFQLRRVPVDDEDDMRFPNHVIQRDTYASVHETTLSGNVPGKEYLVQCEMDCTSGDTLLIEKQFTSPKPSCIQMLYTSPYCALSLVLFIGFLSLCMTLSYVPYEQFVRVNSDRTTQFVLTDAAVQCGGGNSDKYKSINVQGSLQGGDSLQGIIRAWLVPRDDVRLYSQQRGPFPDGYPLLDGQRYTLLLGWSIYLWEGSVISGYCCVQNQNDTDVNASLHLFTDDEATIQYRDGEPPTRYVLAETVNIKPGTTHCFTEWGKNKPYTVKKNSYHFFILHVSKDNTNFTSKITLNQSYVNTSDYANPHYFNYDNDTYFKFPNNYLHPTDYIAICQAPSYLDRSNISHPEAESLHMQSWNNPYLWKYYFEVLLIFGCFGLIPVCIGILIIICYFCNSFFSRCRRNRYTRGYSLIN